MKIQLDTTKKTITLSESVKLQDLVDILDGLLPDGKWKEFTLETSLVNWSPTINPAPIDFPFHPFREPNQPYYPSLPSPQLPWITYSNDDSVLAKGVYNVEVKING